MAHETSSGVVSREKCQHDSAQRAAPRSNGDGGVINSRGGMPQGWTGSFDKLEAHLPNRRSA